MGRIVTLNRLLIVMVLLILVAGAYPSQAQTLRYPERPVTMIVGFAPGGGNDLSARALVEAAKPYFPQPITVVNKTGGSGTIAVNEVFQAKPDGYTLGCAYGLAVCYSPHTTNLPYKGPEDFQAVAGVSATPTVLPVRNDSPFKTWHEMRDYAKSNPGKLRFGTGGPGSVSHMMGLELMRADQLNFAVVPFAGGTPLVAAVLGGHVETGGPNPGALTGHVNAGTIRVLLNIAEKRLPVLPHVPTVRELGYKFKVVYSNYFVIAPKGTPKQVVQTLNDAFKKALESEFFQKFANNEGVLADYKDPEELRRQLESDYAFFGEVAKK